MTPTIKAAMAADEAPAIGAVALAFSVDPAARWTWPDPQKYLTHFPKFVRAFAGRAFAHGSAYFLDGYAGAALWLPPEVQPDEAVLLPFLERAVPEPIRKDVFAVLGQMDRHHPSEPHWYLPMIGVDPAHQGKGYGSALMQHALIACDREKMPAYLESSNPKNIPLYERHGFEVLGTIQAGNSPTFYPMLRKPR